MLDEQTRNKIQIELLNTYRMISDAYDNFEINGEPINNEQLKTLEPIFDKLVSIIDLALSSPTYEDIIITKHDVIKYGYHFRSKKVVVVSLLNFERSMECASMSYKTNPKRGYEYDEITLDNLFNEELKDYIRNLMDDNISNAYEEYKTVMDELKTLITVIL